MYINLVSMNLLSLVSCTCRRWMHHEMDKQKMTSDVNILVVRQLISWHHLSLHTGFVDDGDSDDTSRRSISGHGE